MESVEEQQQFLKDQGIEVEFLFMNDLGNHYYQPVEGDEMGIHFYMDEINRQFIVTKFGPKKGE